MKNLLKYGLPALALFIGLSGAANAQSTNNLWRKSGNNIYPVYSSSTIIGSSTYSGSFSSITVGSCSGCSSSTPSTTIPTVYGLSNVSTSSVNTWSANQSFSAGVNTTGNTTSTTFSATSSVASNISNLNSTFYINPGYATFGCFGSATTTDLGACANLAYSLSSSSKVIFPSLPPFTPYTTPINLGTNNYFADLECQPGQILLYAGATSSYAITFNEGTGYPNSSNHIPHLAAANCTFAGQTSGATSSANVGNGILIGGTNGESQLELDRISAINFNIGWTTATNTYMVDLQAPQAHGNIQAWSTNSASNSGESVKAYSVNFNDNGNSSSSNCVVLNSNGSPSFLFSGGSMDNCQLHIKSGNLNVEVDDIHSEDPGTQGPYDRVVVDADANGTHLIWDKGTIMEDQTSTLQGGPINEMVACAAFCQWEDITTVRNGSATTTKQFSSTNGGSGTSIQEYKGIENQNSAWTQLISAQSQATDNGDLWSYHGNYLAGTEYTGSTGNQYYVFCSNNGVCQTITGNISGSGSVFGILYSQTKGVASSSIDIRGTLSLGVNFTSASTTASGMEAGVNGNVTYDDNASSPTNLLLPPIPSSTYRVIPVVNRGTGIRSIQGSATTTDYLWIHNVTTTAFSLTGNESIVLQNDGTYWVPWSDPTQQYTTAVTIGGSALSLGACTSTATSVDSWVTSTLPMSLHTMPQTFPGAGVTWNSYISASGQVTTEVCALTSTTPTASKYTFTIQ